MKVEREERGQALIVMVFAIVGLLAAVGLALDGGMVLLERRRMQNGADAASLAGTRKLAEAICNPSGVGDAAVAAEVSNYAQRNGVPNGNVVADYVDPDQQVLGRVGAGDPIPTGAAGISATVEISRSTHFVSLMGIGEAGAGAQALAMTGPVVQFGGGVLPIGVPLAVVEAMEEGESFHVIETNGHHGGQFCTDDSGNWDDGNGDVTCVGDPASHNAHRGWLNLNYIYNPAHLTASDRLNRSFEQNVANRGCGADANLSTDDGLRGWASGDCPYPYPILAGAVDGLNGDFIHGDPGARDSSLQEVASYEGQIAYAPVFDYIYMSDYMADNFDPPEEPDVEGASLGGDHWPRAGGGGHAFLYHIVGFTAVRVDDVAHGGGDKYLEGEFQYATIGDGVIIASEGFGNPQACNANQLYGVQLNR